jgi:hypothetical protein
MFQDCIQLNSIPQLNTASASNMSSMFSGCRNLVSDKRERGIPFLDTQNVTNMSNMFLNCQKIKTIPHFNTRWVSTFQSTFQNCWDLQEVPLLNTASASRMDSMFQNCISIQRVPFFNTQNVTNFSSMFQDCHLLSEVPNFNMATASSVNSMFDCFNNPNTDTGSGSLYTIPNFNFSSTIAGINMTNFLAGQEKLTWIPQLNTSRVTSMGGMFYGCTNLRECPTLDMSLVTGIGQNGLAQPNRGTYYMFRGCANLRKVGNLNMPVNTRMDYMFYNCYNLQTIENIFTTSAMVLVASAFSNCHKLRQIPQFNTTAVSTAVSDNNRGGLYQMFIGCYSLTSAPGLTTSNVVDFELAFYQCYSLKIAPNYDTSSATNLTQMFRECTALDQVPVYNIQNVGGLLPNSSSVFGGLNGMFRDCFNITSVTFSNISATNNVSMYLTFISCINLRTVSMPNIRINYPTRTFDSCNSLVDVGTFSVVSVVAGSFGNNDRGYYAMFNNCHQLTNLRGVTLNPIPLSNANDFRLMFNGCNSLIETPSFSMTFSATQDGIFTGCNSLSIINATDNKLSLSFQGCNLDYNNIISEIGSFQTYSTITNLTNRTINFLENPGLPEMMNFWKRKLLYDKGYTYSTGTYNWTNLNLYVQVGDTYSYTDGSTTLFDISGLSFSTSTTPPIFSNSISTTNGTLLNGPTFNTNYLEFNGSDQSISFGSSSTTLLSTVTVFAVIEPLALPSGATVSIIGRYGASGEDNYFLDFTDGRLRFGFKQSGSSIRRQRISNRTFNVGQKYFVAARYQSAQASCILWVNEIVDTSYFSDNITSQTMDQTSSSILSIAGNVAANSSYANIRVYAAGVYNRLLSQEQIEELQSFFRRQGIL